MQVLLEQVVPGSQSLMLHVPVVLSHSVQPKHFFVLVTATPPLQTIGAQRSFVCGASVSSAIVVVPPLPLQTMRLQSPGVCLSAPAPWPEDTKLDWQLLLEQK
jgi:hypothetical protein